MCRAESNEFCVWEHSGTHLDSPIHFVKDAWGIDEIPIERLYRRPGKQNVESTFFKQLIEIIIIRNKICAIDAGIPTCLTSFVEVKRYSFPGPGYN